MLYKIRGDNIQPDDDIISSMEFGEPYFNPNRRDSKTRIFHSIAMTDNYIVVPENSLVMPTKDILTKTINGIPIVETYHFGNDVKGAFAIISKKTMKLIHRVHTAKKGYRYYHLLI
jgi:thermostable 8-oxoguanine DNA glycosylase